MGNWSDWLTGITPAARRLIPFARSAVSAGISGNEFIRTVRAAGIGARRADLVKIMSELKRAYKNPATYVDVSNPANKPIAELIPEALGRQKRAYSYVMKVELFDTASDSFYTDHVTIASSTILDVGEMNDAVYEQYAKYGMAELITEGSVGLAGITHSNNPIFRG